MTPADMNRSKDAKEGSYMYFRSKLIQDRIKITASILLFLKTANELGLEGSPFLRKQSCFAKVSFSLTFFVHLRVFINLFDRSQGKSLKYAQVGSLRISSRDPAIPPWSSYFVGHKFAPSHANFSKTFQDNRC